MISRSTLTFSHPKSTNSILTSESSPSHNQLYCNQRHCTEKQQQFKCAHKLHRPNTSFYIYRNLFVTWVCLYSSLGNIHSFNFFLHPPLPPSLFFSVFLDFWDHLGFRPIDQTPLFDCTKGRWRDLIVSKKKKKKKSLKMPFLICRWPVGAKKDQRFNLRFILDWLLFWMLFCILNPCFNFLVYILVIFLF